MVSEMSEQVVFQDLLYTDSLLALANMPLSRLETAKRAFVSLLLLLARKYVVPLVLARDSADQVLLSAFRKLSRKVHPDRGGSLADSQKLNAAKDLWEEAWREKQAPGRPRQQRQSGDKQVILPTVLETKRGFRIQSLAVLLTYQGIVDLAQWSRFKCFISHKLRSWKANLETNRDEGYHAHLALQFHAVGERSVKTFSFEGITPKCRTNDFCGDGLCKKRLQQSIDRGFFYVWAEKQQQ